MPRFPYDTLVDFCAPLLVAKGMGKRDARHVAEMAVKTEAFGITTHGIKIVPFLVGALGDKIDPKAKPEIVSEKPASALIDAHEGVGQLAMKLAKELAAKKARACGVAMVGVRNASWIGAIGIYLVSLAEDGLLAHLWAQTSTCKDCAPVGGIDATFSTNPIALAFPTGGDPALADFSTAAYALGRVFQMAKAGKKAPEPLFLDKNGALSDDPKVVTEGGSILFTGGRHLGHKGYALSLWCEALTAVSGGDCNNPAAKQHQNFTLLVIDPRAFAGAAAYRKEMKRFVAHMKASRKRPGVDVIRLPGERGYAALRDATQNGVPLGDDILIQLNDLAAKAGVAKLG